LVPTSHDEIDVMRLSAGRDGTGRISHADIDAIGQLAAPSARFSLEVGPGARPLRLDDRSWKFAVHNMKDGQVAVSFQSEPGGSPERDLRRTSEIMCQEHPVPFSRGVRMGEFQSCPAGRLVGRARAVPTGTGCWDPIAG
jgi:hypothetical protein